MRVPPDAKGVSGESGVRVASAAPYRAPLGDDCAPPAPGRLAFEWPVERAVKVGARVEQRFSVPQSVGPAASLSDTTAQSAQPGSLQRGPTSKGSDHGSLQRGPTSKGSDHDTLPAYLKPTYRVWVGSTGHSMYEFSSSSVPALNYFIFGNGLVDQNANSDTLLYDDSFDDGDDDDGTISDCSTSYSYGSDLEGIPKNWKNKILLCFDCIKNGVEHYCSDHTFCAPAEVNQPGNEKFHRHRRRSKCPQQQIQQRQAANLRERRRMRSINEAFEGLRNHIPTMPYEKRLSKVDTLKLAISYINFLSEILKSDKTSCNPDGSVKMPTSNGRIYKREPEEEPKKITVKTAYGPHCQYHLSWSRNKENLRDGIMRAKVWTPEKLTDAPLNRSPPYSDDSPSSSSQFE